MNRKTAYNSKNGLPQEAIGALADAFDKSFITISRWVKTDNHILTSDTARAVFSRLNIEWKTKAARQTQ